MRDFGKVDFAPFQLCEAGGRAPKPRRMGSPEGLGDRMRSAAFAELQAVRAFTFAAERFGDAPAALREAWRAQIADERRHYQLIVERMDQLGQALDARPVSAALWRSLVDCADGRAFCLKIVAAEERGRQAALRLAAFLEQRDPPTAEIFRTIAAEEVAHVALAQTFFGWTPGQEL